ncbi:MAG: phosphoenolpyruvate--protein phosphotransferase [Candidatus Cloacimonetes bacterium]|nr:phosphoenolpyruvate--protein phosphotransferase [Candidatus Cloacimonadota bacterium]
MAMRSFNGIVIRPGLVIGEARLLKTQNWVIRRHHIIQDELEAEQNSLNAALARIRAEMEQQLQAFKGADSDREILESHLLILDDPEMLGQIRADITDKLLSAAAAVEENFQRVRDHFTALEDPYFAQRASDFKDVQHRLLHELTGSSAQIPQDWQPGQIAVLEEAEPSLVNKLAQMGVEAYCAEHGSYTSHASILSRSLKLTALASLPNIFQTVNNGDTLILDALQGKAILNPDADTLNLYQDLLKKYQHSQETACQEAELPTQTQNGQRIKLRLNLDLNTELEAVKQGNPDGVGLYRTEFLYLGQETLPDEESQFQVYRRIAERYAPHSVTIRTFDLGGDKISHLIPSAPEENPYLGLRGIRFSLAHQQLFETQIRAALRASAFGRVKLMLPMVADLKDFLAAREIVHACMDQLAAQGLAFDPDIPLGVMIEIPSAALCSEELAVHCDFMSIGTNDLVQYTLAADRNHSGLTAYYTSHHPAVLKLMQTTLMAGEKQGKAVSICGEMASQAEYLPLLIGMGFKELSVAPASWLNCKAIIRRCDEDLFKIVKKADLNSLSAIENLVFERLKPYYNL